MKGNYRRILAGALMASALTLSLGNAALAQTAGKAAAKKALPGSTWESIAKDLPDWSGAWALDNESFNKTRQTSDSPDRNNPNVPKLTQKWWDYRYNNKVLNKGADGKGATNNAATCIPDGMPGVMTTPLQFEFLFTPGRLTVISSNVEVRRIYTDGRGFPEDMVPKFEGHSIGHWEGDTLVVETKGILPKAEMFVGLPQTGNTQVVERMHKVSDKKFQIDFVVTNPDMYTEPFKYTRTYEYTPVMEEAICMENNRDNNDAVDLTPPPL